MVDSGYRSMLRSELPCRRRTYLPILGLLYCKTALDDKSGSTFEHPVSALDIMPTVLAAAGVEIVEQDQVDGVNLRPFLDGSNKGTPHRYLFWRRGVAAAVLDGTRWKLIRVEGLPLALFDLKSDPGERDNVSEEHPEIRDRLLAELLQWEETAVQPLWDEGETWKRNQIRKHGPDVSSRDEERAVP